MLGVGLALAALGAGVVLARGGLGGRPGAAGGLQLVGRAALGPGQAAHLVRVGDRLLVVGTGRGGAPRLLADLDADPARAAGATTTTAPPPDVAGGAR
jgi:flagellar biogenesis protein FliO